jgi:hypothetical protein
MSFKIMKFATWCLLFSCSAVSAQTNPIPDISYDKFEDSTSVVIKGLLTDPLVALVAYTCPGNTSHCAPRSVEFLIINQPGISAINHQELHDLYFLVDEKRFPKFDTKYRFSASDRWEYMTAHIPIALFRQIAQAGTVEGKIGLTTFKLTASDLAKLRRLANEMQAAKRQ